MIGSKIRDARQRQQGQRLDREPEVREDDLPLACSTAGAALRIADATGAQRIVLTPRCLAVLHAAVRAWLDRDAAEERAVDRAIQRGLAWNREHGQTDGPRAA